MQKKYFPSSFILVVSFFSNKLALITLLLALGVANVVWGQTADVEYTSGSATFTVPAGVTSIEVRLWGGGGGGGGSNSNGNGGSGGGSGAYTVKIFNVSSSQQFSYAVGTAGSAGAATGGTGGNGTASTFIGNGQDLSAGGGGGGLGNATANGAGSGGATSGGGTGSTAGNPGVQGAASGGNGGSAPNGGTGGAGVTNGAGGAGNAPGGGGGGGERAGTNNPANRAGGAGGAGKIEIFYFYSAPTITSFSPSSLCSSGGQSVTITGTNFTGASSVTFNGVAAASFTVNSSTQITATSPSVVTAGVIQVTTAGGTASSSSYTVSSTPAQPGSITGTATQCPATSGLVYSIASVSGATTYTWTVPTGWSITAGQGTTSIIVTSGSAGQNGNISVTAGNSCGTSTARTLGVTVASVPAIPTISTTAATCSSAGTATVTNYNSGLMYTFSPSGPSVGSGGVISGMVASTSYTVTAGNGSCTSAASTSFSITAQLSVPAAVTASGAGTFCNSTTVSASGGAGGTIYWQGTTSNGTSTATASSSQSVTSSGTYYFRALSSDGCWGEQGSVTVTINSDNTVSASSSNPSLCTGVAMVTNVTYTTTGATGIGTPSNFPPGLSANFSSNTITISGTPTTAGTYNYSIPLTGGCGSVNASGTITVTNSLGTVGEINGTAEKCEGLTGQIYNITAPDHASSYTWSVPTGWSITAGQGTNQITVTVGSGGQNGNISVTVNGANGCGSVTKDLAVTSIVCTTPVLSVSPLTGFGNVCVGTTAGPNSFIITGTNLDAGNISVAALSGYSYATSSGGTYTSSLTLSQSGGSYSQEIFVKLAASAAQSYNGNISVSGGGATTVNVAASGTGIAIPAAPTGSAAQTFCSGANPTVANLTATGTAIQWYDAASGGSLLASSTTLNNSTTYYASQTVNGCESSNRLAVTVTITTSPAAPTGSASQTFCANTSPTLASISVTGTAIQWYAAAASGSPLASSTALVDGTTYYASQTVSSCESTTRLAVTATVTPLPSAAGTISGTATVCAGTSNVAYSVGSIANATSYTWSYSATGATISGSTNSITINFASNATSGNLTVKGVNACGEGTISANYAITINAIPSAPTASAIQTFCSGANPTVASLTATGTAIQWYAGAIGGSPLASGSTLTTTNYYASQTVNGCESSDRVAVAVTVNTTPSSPSGSASQTFCVTDSPTLASISVTGTAIQWYAAAASGSPLASSTALVDGTTYYASQTVSGCESTTRLAVTTTLTPLPSAAGAISGTEAVCAGTSDVEYSVGSIANATSYTWSYSGTGATISGSTNSITINFASNATSGNLTVKGINACGEGTVSANYAITINSVPSAPGTVQGLTLVFEGQSGVSYSVGSVADATGYTWSLPSGATIASGTNTNSITVDFASNATSGNVSVAATNGCGAGPSSPNLFVNVGIKLEDEFPTPGSDTWIVPEGVTRILVEAIGAGGSGGSGRGNSNLGGGGGAGGQYASAFLQVSPGEQYNISVASQTGGPTTENSPGNSGSSSSFFRNSIIYVLARGGAGGEAANTTNRLGGVGSIDNGTGDVVKKGGNGGNGTTTASGGGGGGASNGGEGGNANGTVKGTGANDNGGDGGDGLSANGDGISGSNYGGGGSGARRTINGGAGAQGYVKITYAQPVCSGTPALSSVQSSSFSVCTAVNFTLSFQNSPVASGLTYQWQYSLDGSTGWTNVSIGTGGTTNTCTTQLPSAVNYYYRCVVTCGNSNQTSTSNTLLIFYDCSNNCTSSGTTTNQTGTTNVTFNTINNTTPTKTSGYNNFTNQVTVVEKGKSYNLSTSVNSGGSRTVYTRVWIDWNRNDLKEISEADEQYDLGTAFNTSNGVTTLSPLQILVPTTAVNGITRMRVVTKISAFATNPCNTGFDGEVEDYSIKIVDQLAGTAASVVNVSCNGGTDGSFLINPAGGTGPYQYSLNGGSYQSSNSFTNLSSGVYTVTIRDNDNLTVSIQVTITQPTVLNASIPSTQLNCFGDSNGQLTASVTGGTTPYTYSWNTNPVQTTATASNLSAGSYTVTVTDSRGCTTTASGNITQPVQLASSAVANNVLCFNSIDGSITLTVSGGTTPYTFLWSNGQTSQNLSNVAPGSYSVTVTDANNCTSTASATIGAPSEITLSSTVVNVSCNGASDGSITINASGGVGSFQYKLNNGAFQSGNSFSNLAANTYTITVRDGNNCEKQISVTVNQPNILSASASVTNVSCFNGSNGQIALTISGGTSPYTYSWTGPSGYTSNLEDITNLTAGTYSVTVTDANNCSASLSRTLSQPTALQVSLVSKTDVLCFGATTGSINVNVTGGTGPYTYAWSNGASSEDLSSIGAGNYTLTITDANNCSVTSNTISILQPASGFSVSSSKTDVNCFGASTGSASVTVSGATSPYTYSWSPIGGTGSTASNLPANTYTVTITDANACTTSTQVTINQPATALSATSSITNVTCFGLSNGSINVSANGGTSPYTYSIDGTNFQSSTSFTNLAAASYTVTIRDANNCSTTLSATVTQPTQLTVSLSSKTSTCQGVSDGSINVAVAGGTVGYTFSWTGPNSFSSSNQNLIGLSAGSYALVVSDANNCIANLTVVIDEVTPPTTANAGPDQSICGNAVTLAANTPTNGTGQWSVISGTGFSFANINSPTSSFSGTAGTTYVLRWTISNAPCASSTDDVEIIFQNNSLTANAGSDQSLCGISTTLAAVAPTNPATGQWQIVSGEGGSFSGCGFQCATATFTGPQNTNSTFVLRWTVSDGSCSASDDVVINFFAEPSNANAGQDQNICGNSVTLAANTPSIGSGSWSVVSGSNFSFGNVNSPSSSFTGDNGSFTLRWTISNGVCTSKTDDVTIVLKEIPTAIANITATDVCEGESVTLQGSGAGTGGSFSWSGPSLSSTDKDKIIPNVLPSNTGSYLLTVTNSVGCSSTNNAQVSLNVTPATTVANAGADINVCGTTANLNANTAIQGTGTWSVVQGSGGNFGNVNSNTSSFTGNAGETYTLRWTIANNAPCGNTFDEVQVSFKNQPTVANAGSAQSICGLSTTLQGNNPVVGTGKWTIVSGGTGTFGNDTQANSTFSVAQAGTYVLRWTISNSPCLSSSSDVSISFTAPPSDAIAGFDIDVCGSQTTLSATSPLIGNGVWEVVSGSGGNFSSTTDPSATFTGAAGVNYVLRWTVSNGICSSNSDDINVSLKANPTTANAGSNANICGTSAQLNANTPSIGSGSWSIVSGTGGSFNDAALANATFTGVAGNTYTLRWTISNSPCNSSFSDITLSLKANPTVANAGPDQSVCALSTTLQGNTPTIGTGQWVIISGGSLTFTNINSPTSSISGSAGTYVLAWRISNSPCAASEDNVTIVLNNPPTTANAGTDINVCATSAVLAANTPTSGSGQWSIISGVNGVVQNISAPNSIFDGEKGQTYVLRWTISAQGCTSSTDDVTVIFPADPSSPSAGANRSICGNSFVLEGNVPLVGTGTWLIESGVGGSLSSPNNASSAFSGNIGTTYQLSWQITNGACVSEKSTVNITFTEPPFTVNAGTDISECGSSASLNGSFSGVLPAGTPLFTQNFESNNLAGWTLGSDAPTGNNSCTNGGNRWINFTSGSGGGINGTYNLSVNYITNNSQTGDQFNPRNDADIVARTPIISVAGYRDFVLNFKWKAGGNETTAYGQVGYSTDGASVTWLSTKYYNQVNNIQAASIALPSALNGVSNLYIHFRWINTTTTESCYSIGFKVDDVELRGAQPTYLWSGPNVVSGASTTSATVGAGGNYILTVSSGGCSAGDNVNVNLVPFPTGGSIATTQFCEGASINASVTGVSNANSYLWSLPTELSGTSSTSSISISGSQNGSYSIGVIPVNTISGLSCQGNSIPGNVTVNPLPFDQTITGGGAYCSGSSGVVIGLASSQNGVNYQLVFNGSTNVGSPVSGTGSAISFGNQTATGTYTVVATVGLTGCSITLSGSVMVSVDNLPNATFSVIGGGSYCDGGSGVSVGLNSSELNVSYQLRLDGINTGTPVNGTGASISFGNQTAVGTYTVVATNIAGCSANMLGSVSISVNPLPTLFSVTGGGEYCQGGDGVVVGLSGSELGVTYQLRLNGNAVASLSGTGNALSFGNRTAAGTYIVFATNTTTTCANQMSGSAVISINPLPTPSIVSNSPVCEGGTLELTTGSFVSYSWTGPNSFVSSIQSPVITSVVSANGGTYNVSVTDIKGCAASTSQTITINPLPVSYNLSGGGSYCEGSSAPTITLSSSQLGVNYELYLNGNPTGNIVSGTNASLNFGAQAQVGTYTVVASNATTNCAISMNGSVSVSVNPLPELFTLSGGGAYCPENSGLTVTLSGSQIGINYQLIRNGSVNVGSAVAGTGSGLNFNNLIAGTYTIRATNATTGCLRMMDGSISITTHPAPIAYTVTGGGSFCIGGNGVAIGLSNSQVGVSYQLKNSGVNVGSPISGTGSSLEFGLFTTDGTYSVVATTGNGCVGNMSNSVAITTTSAPTALTILGGGAYCINGNGQPISLDGSQSSTSYQLFLNNSPMGSAVLGTGIPISFPGLYTQEGTYTVVATYNSGSCSNSMANSVEVIVNDPQPIITSSPQSICTDGTAELSVQSFTSYSWNTDETSQTIQVSQSNSGTYSYSIQVVDEIGCIGNAIFDLIVLDLPVAQNISGGGTYCEDGTGVEVLIDGSQQDVYYKLLRDNQYTGDSLVGTGSSLNFGLLTTAGTYTAVANNLQANCPVAMDGSPQIVINPLPIVNPITNLTVCNGDFISGINFTSDNAPNSTFTWSNSNTSIGLSASGNGNVSGFTATNTGSTVLTATVTVFATNSLNGVNCSGESREFTITVIPDNTASLASSSPSICINTELTTITHTTTGATGIGNVNGLPIGVSATFNNGVISISGTPSESGDFNYSIQLTGGCGNIFATGSISVILCEPDQPGPIDGLSVLCDNQLIEYAYYEIEEVFLADEYIWTLPQGMTIVSGQGTNQIYVEIDGTFENGFISVIARNQYGDSDPRTKYVDILPTNPVFTDFTYCGKVNFTESYEVTVEGATGFMWYAPFGAVIVSGQNTDSVALKFSDSFKSGELTVIAENGCGMSQPENYYIKATPKKISSITGPSSVCINQTHQYSVPNIDNADYFIWKQPTGSTIVSPSELEQSISIQFSEQFILGRVEVRAANECGSGPIVSLNVQTTNPPKPIDIFGPTKVCGSATFLALLDDNIHTGNYTFNWSLPSGATITSGQGTEQITATFGQGFTSGIVKVSLNDGCGVSQFTSLDVTANTTIGLQEISGPLFVCNYTDGNYATYSVNELDGTYKWTAPSGATIKNGISNKHFVEMTFAQGFESGVIELEFTANCGGATVIKTYAIGAIEDSSNLTGNISGPICIDAGTTNSYTFDNSYEVSNYVWNVSGGASISQGQGTSSTKVFFPSNYTSGTVSVTLTYICGNIETKELVIGLKTAIPIVSGNTTACIGDTLVYSANSNPAVDYYIWKVPTSAKIIGSSTSQSITVAFNTGFSGGHITAQAVGGCGSSPLAYYSVGLCSNGGKPANNDNDDAVVEKLNLMNNELHNYTLTLYPNPTKDIIYYTFNGCGASVHNIVITDAIGKIVKDENERYQGAVDIRNFASGIYYLRIETACGHNLIQKFVVID